MASPREDLKVKELQLAKKGLMSIEDLGKYPNLQKADFSHNQLVNANGLKKCNKLRHLKLSKNQLVSLDWIKKLKNLNVFNAGNNQLTDLEPLEGLNELKALILNNNNISQTLPIQRLTSITTLILSNNCIKEIDVRALSGLFKLQLSHNKIHTFPNIKFNGELKNLSLNDNLIKDVPEPYVETSRLDILDLGKNKIKKFKSIQALQRITRLQQLSLRGNVLCDADRYEEKILTLLPSLRTFDNAPVEKEGGTQHKKKKVSEKEIQSEAEPESKKGKRKRGKHQELSNVIKSHPESVEEATPSDQQTVPKKKKKLKPNRESAPASSLESFKESLQKLEKSKNKSKTTDGLDAIKETASGVVAIHEIKSKKKGKQKKGGGSQDIFSAFQTSVGSGCASTW